MDNSLEDDVFLDPDSIAGLESSIQKSTGRLRTSIHKNTSKLQVLDSSDRMVLEHCFIFILWLFNETFLKTYYTICLRNVKMFIYDKDWTSG